MKRRVAAVGIWVSLGALSAIPAATGISAAAPSHPADLGKLYASDHHGKGPQSGSALLPYSNEFRTILASCWITPENATNTMIDLSQKASELGARNVSSLMMMRAITRRITWKNRQVCSGTFDVAEGHMESGGP